MAVEYADEIIRLLEKSIRDCVKGREKVGLIYSSGVDSTLVGIIAGKITVVTAYNVGLKGSPDRKYAEKTEKDTPFKVSFIEVSDSDIEDAIPMVLKTIGEPNPLKVSVGMPFYFASRKAREDGFSVMLCGQGPDELFGGYARYLSVLTSSGYESLSRVMREDVENLYNAQLKFDERVCRLNGVELKFPYVSRDFIEYALSVPVELKVKEASEPPEYECVDCAGGRRVIRKFVLREAAKKVGVPQVVLNRPKKAAQYGSGISSAIERIARMRGFKEKASKKNRSDYIRFFMECVWDEVK